MVMIIVMNGIDYGTNYKRSSVLYLVRGRGGPSVQTASRNSKNVVSGVIVYYHLNLLIRCQTFSAAVKCMNEHQSSAPVLLSSATLSLN